MSNLTKHTSNAGLAALSEDELVKYNATLSTFEVDDLQVGDMFFDSRDNGVIVKISEIKIEKRIDHQRLTKAIDSWHQATGIAKPSNFFSDDKESKQIKKRIKNDKTYPKEEQFQYNQIVIAFDRNRDWDNTVFSSYGQHDIDQFLKEYGAYKLKKPIQEYLDEANELIEGKRKFDDYKLQQINTESDAGLMVMGSTEHLDGMKLQIIQAKQHASIIKAAVGFQLEKVKQEMDLVRRNLSGIVEVFQKQVKKIQMVIDTIELYLGIQEDIVKIQEGNKASVDTPITFRQEVLCMDEEVGDPSNQGIDFTKISQFDLWLTEFNSYYNKFNYEIAIPEAKGIVIFRVRRNLDVRYSDNPFVQSMMEAENLKTYILIRNGSELYRIWGEITIWPRLFPGSKEMQELKDKWDSINEKDERNRNSKLPVLDENGSQIHSSYDAEKALKRIDDKMFAYKRQMLLLQGILDRTEVLMPTPERIVLMNSSALDKGLVNFVYDESIKLSDGKRKPIQEWFKEINKDVSIGSRIFLSSKHLTGSNKHQEDQGERSERFSKKYREKYYYHNGTRYYNLPANPNDGIYTIGEYKNWEELPDRAVANNADEVPDYEKNRFDGDAWKKYFVDENHSWFVGYPYTYDVYYFDDKHKYNDHLTEREAVPEIGKRKREHGYRNFSWQQVGYPAIYYVPADKQQEWNWRRGYEQDGGPRNVSYKIYLDSDVNFINFDGIDLETLDYYLNAREHRKEYLRFMPLLIGLKELLLKEKAWEANFVLMLQHEVMTTHNMSEEHAKQRINEEITWWKLKNKWKRAISSDDAKACRMIRKKLGLK